MKKFSEDHGGVAIILIVIAVLLLIVGSVKGLDEGTGKVNGSGVASVVGNAYSNAIDKYLKLNHKLANMQILMVMEL